jgi:RNA polymerase sigma-70 factor (ECF subfamily)
MSGIDNALESAIGDALDAGDANRAATAALRGYGPQVLGYLVALLRDDTLSEEAFSSFSEDVWVGLPGFRRECSFRTWAYKLAWHAAMRAARDPKRKRNAPLATSMASAIAAEVRSSTAPHLKSETKNAVRQLREELTVEEQTLLVLRVDRDLSWRDIAEVMGSDEAALRKRFERVKEKLRGLAKARGLLAD